MKVYKKVSQPKLNGVEIRYTRAKMKAEEFIKTSNLKWDQEEKELFKLKRFQNVSTKIDNKR